MFHFGFWSCSVSAIGMPGMAFHSFADMNVHSILWISECTGLFFADVTVVGNQRVWEIKIHWHWLLHHCQVGGIRLKKGWSSPFIYAVVNLRECVCGYASVRCPNNRVCVLYLMWCHPDLRRSSWKSVPTVHSNSRSDANKWQRQRCHPTVCQLTPGPNKVKQRCIAKFTVGRPEMSDLIRLNLK